MAVMMEKTSKYGDSKAVYKITNEIMGNAETVIQMEKLSQTHQKFP